MNGSLKKYEDLESFSYSALEQLLLGEGTYQWLMDLNRLVVSFCTTNDKAFA